MKKLRVGIMFGGKSAEHDISCLSAKNVFEAIDRTKYEPVLIGIDANGTWLSSSESSLLLGAGAASGAVETNEMMALMPEGHGLLTRPGQGPSPFIDVAFPILHGPFGEDGTVQGLLKLAGVPFVGSGVLGSAVGMDKDVMKRLLRDAGVPIGDFLVCHAHERDGLSFADVVEKIGQPFFLKPANLGSSVGISKVHDEAEFARAVDEAFQFDRKVLLERNIPGREIECAVLGNENPRASVLGEIKPNHEFYSYEAKYLDEHGAALMIPAELPSSLTERIQSLALKTFKALEAEGMARVDFFVTEDERVFVNEINTIPGFTSVSMFPKLWEHSGIAYADLIDQLIQLAIARFAQEKKLKTKKD